MQIRLKLEKKLKEISEILSKEYKQNPDIGVLSGISGIALFHFYYSKYLKIDKYNDIGLDILSEVIDRINKGYYMPTFCAGIAGATWAFEHLLEERFINLDNGELLADLDNYLFSVMKSEMKIGQFDFLHGGIGFAYYFLKRYRNSKIPELKERYKLYLSKMISDLERTAQKDPNGLKWESKFDIQTDLKEYNLSLSHGMSSIIILLTKLHQIADFSNRVTPLLKGAITYIQSQKMSGENLCSLFPNKILSCNQEVVRTRLAWCYGDLGIGLAFWHASKILKDDDLKNIALEIMKHGARRRTDENTGIVDASICHGSFGNAQIFNHMFKETNHDLFKEASLYWIDYGLKMAVHEGNNAGYKQWQGEDRKWETSTALLDGLSGIGLVIISYIANFKSNWDECLMIS